MTPLRAVRRFGFLYAAVIAALACGLPGCTDESAPRRDGGPPVDAAPQDAGSTDAGERTDAGPPPRPDAGDVDGGPDFGLQCQSCASDDECAFGSYCVELPSGGQVCLRVCEPDLPDCPDRFDCINSLIRALPQPVCTPVGERCCVDEDGDEHGIGVGCNGLDCDESRAGVYEGARETCDGVDEDCDGTIDEGDPGAGMVCSTGLSGACAPGVTVCESGSILCRANAAIAAETCDGFDNDCDGSADEDDEGRALTRPCYDGPAGTDGVGRCASGVQTCAGGEYRGCIDQVLPGTEVCDGLDNDCDGSVDDGNPGGGYACTTASPGVCAPGTATCVDGSVQCVGAIAPGARTELCNAVDDDCDGVADDGFPGLGTTCVSGLGLCRRVGITLCDPADPAAAPICDAVPGTPSAAEACDYVDDDCDGTVDDGFRNAAGIYDTVAHCGACGADCALRWPGGPATYHVVTRCIPGAGYASCGFTCEAGWINADGIADNGCELSPEADTVYVSTPANGGADVATCGAWDAPCATVGGGILRAQTTARARVRVSTGLYRENVTLVSGISVLGGHSHVNWVRNPAVFASTIRGVDAAVAAGGANDRIVVSAVGITLSTELSGFTIVGVNAGPGGNSVGVYVRDSDNHLLIQQNDIAAGAGGNGATGIAGSAGSAGSLGTAGIGPARRACAAGTIAGAAGATRTCGVLATNGGNGGASTQPTISARSGFGTVGLGTGGGTGGVGGYHVNGYATPGGGYTCTVYGNPLEGGVGSTGASGSDGGGGGGAASSAGSIGSGQWRALGGASGISGTSGGGGGGGGSAGGVLADAGAYCLYSPTGGGGGAGGCSGGAGAGGGGGGASFAVFIVHTTAPASAATMPRVTGNDLRRGSGGRGGDGGTGGGGGEGGAGGNGGATTGFVDNYAFCLTAGGPGGAGGRGGHGGGGGGGAGGASFDVWVSRPGGATPDYSTNVFEIGAAVGTGGSGGGGGNSSNTAIGLGGSGVAGPSGQLRIGS